MKKDINFLEVKKQGENKKGANTTAILVVVMLIVIGVMGFMYGSTMNKIKDLDSNIAKLEQETTGSNGKYAKRNEEYNKIQKRLESFMLETLKKSQVDNCIGKVNTISRELFNEIYSSCEDNGEKKVNIVLYTFESNSGLIKLTCNLVSTGEITNELLNEIDYFTARLNEKEHIKSAESSSTDIKDNVIVFNVTITMEQKVIENEVVL